MKVITISGKAGHGKDFTANAIAGILREQNETVLILHYADLLKFICTNLFGWNGEKDESGRRLLQHVGTNIVREKKPDFWVNYILDILELFGDEWDFVIIPDARFPNEIDDLINASRRGKRRKQSYESYYDKEANDVHPLYSVTSIRVIRPDFDNKLTDDAKQHISEHALDGYKFDYTLFNSGKGDYVDNINYICKELFGNEEVDKNGAFDD